MAEQRSDQPNGRADASPQKVDIDWLKTTAGALAAVSTAVLLSTLGAAGTLMGAALGSVAATVGSAIYTQGLARSKRTMLKAQEAALLKVGVHPAAVRQAQELVKDEHEDVAEVDAALPNHSDRPPSRWRTLPWKRVGAVAGATFLAVMIVITSFEWAAGRSLSSYTGGSSSHQGSTLGGVTGSGSGSGKHSDQPSRSPSGKATPTKDSASSSASPSSDPTSASPTATPSESPSSTPTQAPTESTTPSPAATPSASP